MPMKTRLLDILKYNIHVFNAALNSFLWVF